MFIFENVSKQFTKHFILQNFSFEILDGDKVIVVGRSGIGKTTLFRLLLGFEKPETGNIYFENQLLTDQSVWELRKQVAYVSQDLNIGEGKINTFFDDTFALKANIQHKNSLQNELTHLLEHFELPESILNKNIEDLSGGEKQRIAIINAILLKRKIFLLDEMTSALDKKLKIKTFDFFFGNPEFTVLSISHDDYLPTGIEIKTINLDQL